MNLVQLGIRLLYRMGDVTFLLISATIGILSFLRPCQPILLTSFLCTKASTLIGQGHVAIHILHLLLATIDLISFQEVCIGGIYYLITLLLQIISFAWMSCQAFVKSRTEFIEAMITYKELKVYEKVLNSCIKSRIFLVTALLIPAMQILMCFTAIQMFRSEQISKGVAVFFLWTYFVTLLFTILMFSGAAQINNLSTNWIVKCRQRCRTKVEWRTQKS